VLVIGFAMDIWQKLRDGESFSLPMSSSRILNLVPWETFEDEVNNFAMNADGVRIPPIIPNDFIQVAASTCFSGAQTTHGELDARVAMMYLRAEAAKNTEEIKCKMCRKRNRSLAPKLCKNICGCNECSLLCVQCQIQEHTPQADLPRIPPYPGTDDYNPLVIGLGVKSTIKEMPGLLTKFEPMDLGLVNKAIYDAKLQHERNSLLYFESTTRSPCASRRDELYETLDIGREEIRLLELIQGAWSDPISCELRTVSLKHHPQFEALSYAWGDPKSTMPLLVNGRHVFQATASLESGLRRLRRPTKSVTLWVDAICINQMDTAEREHQVGLMHKIYSLTSQVHIWLGVDAPSWNSTENSRSAIRVIQWLASDVHLDELPFVCDADPTIMPFSEHGPLLLRAFIRFVEKPWWKRAWVIQEIVLPPKATVHVGFVSTSWELMVAASMCLEKHLGTCCGSERHKLSWIDYLTPMTKFSRTVKAIQMLRTAVHGVCFFRRLLGTGHVNSDKPNETIFYRQTVSMLAKCLRQGRKTNYSSFFPNSDLRRPLTTATKFFLSSAWLKSGLVMVY
jgi:hypothetical protein